jgi:hypothetical protein
MIEVEIATSERNDLFEAHRTSPRASESAKTVDDLYSRGLPVGPLKFD